MGWWETPWKTGKRGGPEQDGVWSRAGKGESLGAFEAGVAWLWEGLVEDGRVWHEDLGLRKKCKTEGVERVSWEVVPKTR